MKVGSSPVRQFFYELYSRVRDRLDTITIYIEWSAHRDNYCVDCAPTSYILECHHQNILLLCLIIDLPNRRQKEDWYSA